jgi:hypothetical protein
MDTIPWKIYSRRQKIGIFFSFTTEGSFFLLLGVTYVRCTIQEVAFVRLDTQPAASVRYA